MLALIMIAVAVAFGTVTVLGFRQGVLPFWAFPIKRSETPELFNIYLVFLTLFVLIFLAAAVIAWWTQGAVY
jgi:hypothetical protein